jgi:diguanylate cyclase (GGDEF)-like protein
LRTLARLVDAAADRRRGAFFRIAEVRLDRMERPEYALFAAWTVSEVILGLSAALSGGPTIPTMSWFAIPLLTLGARFSERGIIAGTAITIALLLAVAFGVDAGAVVANPPLVIAPITLLLCVSLFQTVLMRSEVRYRAAAVVDPLTSLLNRGALALRVAELEHQAAVTRQPVALIVGDLDHFKLINDTYGHDSGDNVLQDVAYQMRKVMRAFDLIYRLGGEEFLILLPGMELDEALRRAEDVRAAIAAAPRGGRAITMSLGVAATAPGEPFSYKAVFGAADAALYEAKHAGRNRVCASYQSPASMPAA